MSGVQGGTSAQENPCSFVSGATRTFEVMWQTCLIDFEMIWRGKPDDMLKCFSLSRPFWGWKEIMDNPPRRTWFWTCETPDLASFLSLTELVWRQWLCKLVGNNTRRGSWNPEALDNSRALLSDGEPRKLKFLAATELLMKLRRLLTWYFAVRILLRRHARKQCRFLLLFAGVGRVV